MTSRLNPYISFDGNAREAMEFYQSVFGGDADAEHLRRVRPRPTRRTPTRSCTRMLETDSGFTLMAADTPPGMAHNPGNNITVSLSGDDGDELRGYWEKLSASGTVSMPLEKQMWGDEFGMCTDRFGIAWMVNIAQPQA